MTEEQYPGQGEEEVQEGTGCSPEKDGPKEEVILFFDTETSGFPSNRSADDPKQAWIVELGFMLSTKNTIYTEFSSLIYSDDRYINPGAQATHGRSNNDCDTYGIPELTAIEIFNLAVLSCDRIVCHNYDFDAKMINLILEKNGLLASVTEFNDVPSTCTMKAQSVIEFCGLTFKSKSGYKWPRLEELHDILFKESFEGAHSALNDVRATRRCYYELVGKGLI